MHHRSFGLVLAGGGARGMAHVGALRALHHLGYQPSMIVGVSMGALIGATYALNPNWYRDLVEMDVSGFPVIPTLRSNGLMGKFRNLTMAGRDLKALTLGWGVGERSVDWGRSVIDQLTLGKSLEEGRLPIAISATDILSGQRVVKTMGNTVDAVYASSALAGILPPFKDGPRLLADGGYADSAPIDLVQAAGVDCVIVIDPDQYPIDHIPRNGLDVLLRSIEVTHLAYSKARYRDADLVLTPNYGSPVGLLEFEHKRRCIAAGAWAVRQGSTNLARALDPMHESLSMVSAQ